jgi:t-SNARE complex subunit (syntaxin)
VASTGNGSNMFARYKAQTIIITPNSIMEIVFVPFDEIKESQNRLLAILEIEHDVNLIKEMFIELNSMIEEQSIPIQTIVVQIEEAKQSSKVANDDITESDRYAHQSTSKIKYLLFIGITVFCIIKLI